MVNTKVNLTILLQGGTMLSERDCSKEVKKPVMITRGKYAGKQKKDKEGNRVYKTVLVPDPTKTNLHSMRVSYVVNGELQNEVLNFSTRGCKPVKQSLNICEEAYNYMVGKEVPDGYKYPYGFKPNKALLRKGMSISSQAWNAQSDKEKLEWHLNRICADRGGILSDYTVFND